MLFHSGPSVGRNIQRSRWLILAILCLSLSVISIDNTIVTGGLPKLAQTLGSSHTDLEWIIDGYTIVFAGLLLSAGSLSDRKGRKGILQVGLALFALTSVWAAFADTSSGLITARLLMGAAAALIMPSTLAILAAVFPKEERAKALGIWTAVLGLGVATGPLIGGFLLDHYWWGSIFLINVPIVAVALTATAIWVPTSRDPKPNRPDVLGTILWTMGMFAVMFVIIQSGQDGFGAAHVIAAVFIAILGIGGFVFWERHTNHPMLDIRLLANGQFRGAMVSVALTQFALYGAAFLIVQYLQLVLGYSAFASGAALLPAIISVVVMSATSSVVVGKLGTRTTVSAGLVCVTAGLALGAYTLSGTSNYPLLALAMALIGAGLGVALPPAENCILTAVPREKTGVGSAVNDTVLELGGGLGVAVQGSIVVWLYQSGIHSATAMLPPALQEKAKDSLAAAIRVSEAVGKTDGTTLADTARHAFTSGMRFSLIVGAIIVFAGAIIARVTLPAQSPAEPLH